MGSEGGEIHMTRVIVMEDVTLSFPLGRSMGRELLDLLAGGGDTTKRRFTALKKVSLEIKQGEVLGVIGRNGSGKSTLLRVMAGIYRPDSGSVRAVGRTQLLAGVSVGMNPNLTGRENVHLYGSILGHDKKTMDGMMADILEFSEIGDFIDLPLRTYSSGMKARLGLSIASSVEPDILLIDEVLGVGDPQFREKSKKRILDLVKTTGTVVIVSHSFGLMTEICDRVVLVHQGKIAGIGEPKDIIKKYYDITE
jgi:ABC-type polysaccharide/polyol phosphate transport system ATPase subunit